MDEIDELEKRLALDFLLADALEGVGEVALEPADLELADEEGGAFRNADVSEEREDLDHAGVVAGRRRRRRSPRLRFGVRTSGVGGGRGGGGGGPRGMVDGDGVERLSVTEIGGFRFRFPVTALHEFVQHYC